MIGAITLHAQNAGTARAYFGPVPKGASIDGLFVWSAAFSNTAHFSLECRAFTDHPGDDPVSFGEGEPLFQLSSAGDHYLGFVNGVQSYIPLEVEADRYSWIGVQLRDDSGTSTYASCGIQFTPGNVAVTD